MKKATDKQWERKETPPRPEDVIAKEWAEVTQTLGVTDYQIEALKGRAVQLRNRVHELTVENQKAQELKAKADVKPSEG